MIQEIVSIVIALGIYDVLKFAAGFWLEWRNAN